MHSTFNPGHVPPWLSRLLEPFHIRQINLANPFDRERAIAHMDRVFGLHDRFLDHLVKQGSRRTRENARRLLYEMDLQGFIDPYGTAWEAGDGRAAAWWTPPWAKKLTKWETLCLVPIGMRIVGVTRTIEGFSILNKLEAARPDEPHWYLNNLAVDPDLQGQHFGTALMLQILWHADRHGHPCFLMFANPANERYYARFGFSLVDEDQQPQFGPNTPFYKAMIRQPPSTHMVTPDLAVKLLHTNR